MPDARSGHALVCYFVGFNSPLLQHLAGIARANAWHAVSCDSVCPSEFHPQVLAQPRDRAELELVVLVHEYPGQFSANVEHQLYARDPLLPVVHVVGPWCAADRRAGLQSAAGLHLPWHRWESFAALQRQALAAHVCPAWGLPRTATDDERLLAELRQLRRLVPPALHAGRSVAVCSEHSDMREAAAQLLSGMGLTCVATTHAQQHALPWGLFIDMGSDPAALSRQKISTAWRQLPFAAFVDMPRLEDWHAVTAAGGAAVLGKPCHLSELYYALTRFALANEAAQGHTLHAHGTQRDTALNPAVQG